MGTAGIKKVVADNGDITWQLPDGTFSRDDGPAVERANGDKEWWVNGLRHRDNDEPAIEYANGDEEWWFNGVRHRDEYYFEDHFDDSYYFFWEPAVIRDNGDEKWWYKGERDTKYPDYTPAWLIENIEQDIFESQKERYERNLYED